MVRELDFKSRPVEGRDKRFIVDMFNHLESCFEQRKQYDEYRFSGEIVSLTEQNINDLSNNYVIEITHDRIIIDN